MLRKTYSFAILSAVVLLLAAPAVLADEPNPDQVLKVKIPFDFYAENTMLPRGEYVLERLDPNNDEGFQLRSVNGHNGVEFVTEQGPYGQRPSESYLVFSTIGNKHFLSQVWLSNDDQGHQLMEGPAEKRAARAGGKKEQMKVTAEKIEKRMGRS